jgi:hypothetical protein
MRVNLLYLHHSTKEKIYQKLIESKFLRGEKFQKQLCDSNMINSI